ncbi:calcium-binding protein [Sphingobium yanoikuyae]|jgi:Ca2+-binding RTX toxin-like protein|uniref:Calcium-binding protein n=2 Tax=Sphingobium yanoikuyae TaxID=13690 RepID=A0A430BUD8_SPHYA|nr:calcium-binding protein [Sphingobium yanoikuyae]
MTDFVGGPEDNIFNLTQYDGSSNVDGGGGYDILNLTYPNIYVVRDAWRMVLNEGYTRNLTSYYTNDVFFENIELLTITAPIVHSSGYVEIIVNTDRVNALIDGNGGGRLTLDYMAESVGRTFTYDHDGLNAYGLVTFKNIAGLQILGGTGDDILSGDPDNAEGGTITIISGAGNDILDTGAYSGWLYGGLGNDILYSRSPFARVDGQWGDDILYGITGSGSLFGGTGNDTYIIDGVYIAVTEYAGEGVDEVRTSLASYLLPANFEKLTGTSASGQALTGNGGDNYIVGNVGIDTIAGGAGNDVIEGGEGNDILSGETGVDSVSYEHAVGAVQVSLQAGIATGGAGNDQLWDFENVIGSAFADVLTGNDGNNVLAGLAGDDILSGGAGIDTASYEQAAAGVQVSLLAGLATGGAGNDTLSGIENVRGSAYADGLTGDDGNNALSGLAGDDLIEGGAGDDILSGGVGIDSVSYEHAVAGVQVSLAAGVATGGAGNDTLSEFENIRGSAYADMLTGDNGSNALSGLAGADQMIGLGGDDEYWVDNQGDVIVEAVGGGYDRVLAKVDYTLADNVESLTLIGRGNIDAYGNDLDNILTGNSGNNRLRGFGGEDYMAGGAGNDIYHVNSWGDQVVEAPGGGTDLIVSSISIDLLALPDVENVTLVNRWNINLNGNALDNVLTGNSGDNVIRGFGGNDVLSGGAGRDSFGFDAAPGSGDLVQITDFSVADDIILLSHDQFGPIGSGSGGWGSLDPDAFVIGNVAADANDRILYDSATGALFYDADGNGAGAAVQFALLTAGLALTSADFNVIL